MSYKRLTSPQRVCNVQVANLCGLGRGPNLAVPFTVEETVPFTGSPALSMTLPTPVSVSSSPFLSIKRR